MIIPKQVTKQQTIVGLTYIEIAIFALPFMVTIWFLESGLIAVAIAVLLGLALINTFSGKRMYKVIIDNINYIQAVTYYFRDRDVYIEQRFKYTPKECMHSDSKLDKITYPLKKVIVRIQNKLTVFKLHFQRLFYMLFTFKEATLNEGEFDKYDITIDENKQVVITQNGKEYIVKKLVPRFAKWFDNEEEKRHFFAHLYSFYYAIDNVHIYKYHDSNQLEFYDFDTLDNELLEEYKSYQLGQYEKILNSNVPYYYIVFSKEYGDLVNNLGNGSILNVEDADKSDFEIIDNVILGDLNDIQELRIKNDHIVLRTNNDDVYYQKYLSTADISIIQNNFYIEKLMQEEEIDVKLSYRKYDNDKMKKILNDSIKESRQRIYNTEKSNVEGEEASEIDVLRHYQEMLKNDEDIICGFKIIVKIESSDLNQLERIEKELQNKYENLKFTSELFVQKDMLQEWSLIKDTSSYKQLILTDFVYGGLFDYTTSIDHNGFLKFIGKKGLVSLNTTLVDSSVNRQKANMFISGATGSGKTTFAKMKILEDISYGRHIINVDVQGDYKRLFKSVGGYNLDISKGHKLNPLQVTDWKTTNSPIKNHISFLEAFFSTANGCTEQIISTLSYELLEFYSKFDLTEESTPKDYPIMIEFYDYLKEKSVDESITMFIHKFSHNIYSEYFNGHTTIDLSSRYINFCLESIKDNERILDPVLFCIFNIINQKMYDSSITLSVIYDEFHRVLNNKFAVAYINTSVKEARKFDTLIAALSQFLDEIPDVILDQMQYIVFLKNPNMDSVERVTGKSKRLLTDLASARFGEGMIKIDKQILPIDFHFNKREILENVGLLYTFDHNILKELDEEDKAIALGNLKGFEIYEEVA